MATSNVTPSNGFPKDAGARVQKSVLDSNFESITLVKGYDTSIAASIKTIEEAQAYLGGEEKLLEIIKDGINASVAAKTRTEPDGWYDKESTQPYTGEFLDPEKTTPLVLGLAKTVYAGIYSNDPKKAKESAVEFLKSPAGSQLRAGLVAK